MLSVFEDNIAGKQLFLASLISNSKVRQIVEESINGDFAWNFTYSVDQLHESAGAIRISSEFISSCMPEARGRETIIVDYWHPKSLADDVSLLYLILLFYGAMGEPDDIGEGWQE